MQIRSAVLALLPLVSSLAIGVSVVACGAADDPSADEDQAANALDDDGIGADKDAGKKTDGGKADAGEAADAGHDSGTPTKSTWTSIYAEAFAPGTPGHCGNSGCHNVAKAGFTCGTTASSCLSGMIAKGLLSTTSPKSSILGSTTSSPLRWIHSGGPMPADNSKAEPKLAADIEAWVKAGAPGITTKSDEEGDTTGETGAELPEPTEGQ